VTRYLAVLGLICACIPDQVDRRVVKPQNWRQLSVRSESPYLKVHMRDGRVYVLEQWQIDEPSARVLGTGEMLGTDRRVRRQGRFDVGLGDVALLETNRVHASPMIAGLAVVTTISVTVTLACIANPKACFGSCPTFYADGALLAEGFSDSVAPSLEATDVDALWRWRPTSRSVELRMTNEALETHVVRHVRLLAAKRPPGGRVAAAPDGRFHEIRALAPPRACHAEEGDCTESLSALDGHERRSLTDPHDLATRETIDLEFDAPPGRGPLGVVVGARQTLLSTYLFYQLLAYLGRDAGTYLAAFERADPESRARIGGIGRVLGSIEVQVPEGGGGGWRTVGQTGETGPLATDVTVVPLDVPATRIRLRLTRGHWRLDQIALARLGGTVTATPIEPSARELHPAEPERTIAAPDGSLVTLPGDAVTFHFELPDAPERLELFLESRGYYLEWMRKEWEREQNLPRAAMLFADPERALRELAPEFKAREPQLEDLFWRSRFAPRH
jgi:hypothetical protein